METAPMTNTCESSSIRPGLASCCNLATVRQGSEKYSTIALEALYAALAYPSGLDGGEAAEDEQEKHQHLIHDIHGSYSPSFCAGASETGESTSRQQPCAGTAHSSASFPSRART